jgi:hypothetical protein
MVSSVEIVPQAVGKEVGECRFFCKEGTVNSPNDFVLKKLGYKKLVEIKIAVILFDDVVNKLKIKRVDHVNITVNGGRGI